MGIQDILHLYHNDVKFHNAYHALNVFHASKMIINKTKNVLSPLKTFSTLVAAICHDVDHPGFTNHFLIDSSDELALIYNDVSVLENHHVATTFRVLRDEACDIIANLTIKEKRAFRGIVIKAILATDMAHHFSTIDKLKNERHQRQRCQALKSINHTDDELKQYSIHEKILQQMDGQFLIDVIVHASDLSGQAYSKSVALKWSYAIAEEFEQQSQVEQKRKMELTPYMRNANKPGMVWKLQDDFITLVIKPFWVEVVHLFPELKCCMDNISANHIFYKDQLKNQTIIHSQSETKDT